MALAHVAHDGSSSGFAKPTLTVAFSANVTAGNLLVVGTYGSTGVVSSITDTLGNTYQSDEDDLVGGAGGAEVRQYSCISVGSGANTVTLTFASNTDAAAYCMEFSGTVSTSWLDKHASHNDTAGTSMTSNAGGTTTVADELLIGTGGTSDNSSSFTAGTSYTLSAATAQQHLMMEWRIVSATGNYGADMTKPGSGGWAMLYGSYKGPSTAVRHLLPLLGVG